MDEDTMEAQEEDEGGGNNIGSKRKSDDQIASPAKQHRPHDATQHPHDNKSQHEDGVQTPLPQDNPQDTTPNDDANSEMEGNPTEPEINVSNNIVIVELIDRSRDENLVKDGGTLRRIFATSPFGQCSSIYPRINHTAHKLIFSIDDIQDIPDLLKIESIRDEDLSVNWPIRTYQPVENPGLYTFGVMKGIDPAVPENRIKANLKAGRANVSEVTRLSNRDGPTTTVKLKFDSMILPKYINYSGVTKLIHPYIPPNNRLLCHRCGRGGHKAAQCRSGGRQCPICSGPHERRGCPRDAAGQPLKMECPNCHQPGHTANWQKCTYLQREKDIIRIRLENNIPRNQAVNIWEHRERI